MLGAMFLLLLLLLLLAVGGMQGFQCLLLHSRGEPVKQAAVDAAQLRGC